MDPDQRKQSDSRQAPTDKIQPPRPAITLPKGGDAIRGMGEKFAANPVTGTGSLTVPVYTSPGRSGFGPQLSLSYGSGAGNGPFGLGWSLSLLSITRKTEKGIPKYLDAEESDEFILSGTEDLVPVLVNKAGKWEPDVTPSRKVHIKTYRTQHYRPRVEGLFACIEHWTNLDNPEETFWRSISRDNITTWYGKTDDSRITDPADATRIFSWLICESYDDKGNVIVYGYKQEDSAEVEPSHAHERNRTKKSRSANRYLKRITYGNRSPYYPSLGEHDLAVPTPHDTGVWSCCKEPFSSYWAGFEGRTHHLCQLVLMFHHFPNEDEVGAQCLGRSTDLTYVYEQEPTAPRNPMHSVLMSVAQCSYKRNQGVYLKKSLPPLEFAYSQATIHEEVHAIDPESLENLPYGLDNARDQWVDLDGEGLSGILTEQAEGWFCKSKPEPDHDAAREWAGNGRSPLWTASAGSAKTAAGGPQQRAAAIPGSRGDGQLDLVELEGPTPGFYERTYDEGWETLRPFASLPVLYWGNPNLKFVDLAGDGLTDIVRISNGEVCYWPKLGGGCFGAKVTMDHSPSFDHPDQFNQRRIRLADIDGSGVTDILYLGRYGVQLYFNQVRNSWSAPTILTSVPSTDNS